MNIWQFAFSVLLWLSTNTNASEAVLYQPGPLEHPFRSGFMYGLQIGITNSEIDIAGRIPVRPGDPYGYSSLQLQYIEPSALQIFNFGSVIGFISFFFLFIGSVFFLLHKLISELDRKRKLRVQNNNCMHDIRPISKRQRNCR